MGNADAATLREAALFLDRFRWRIEPEVNRRMGREEPPPDVRLEIVRRFRSFCRLASFGISSAQPSLEGLAGNSAYALERTIETAVAVARESGAPEPVGQALETLSARFRAGVRRILEPEDSPRQRRARRKVPNAGRRVRSAIDRIGDAYIALCLDTGRLFDVNPAAENLFAMGAEKLLGRNLVELVADTDRTEFLDLESRLDAGEDVGPAKLTLVRVDGERVPVQVTVSNHTIAGKRLAIFVARERIEPPESPAAPERGPAPPRFLRGPL
jgi:PAS domain S-box-containing protein